VLCLHSFLFYSLFVSSFLRQPRKKSAANSCPRSRRTLRRHARTFNAITDVSGVSSPHQLISGEGKLVIAKALSDGSPRTSAG